MAQTHRRRKPRHYTAKRRQFYDLPSHQRWAIVRWEAISVAGGVCESCHTRPAVQVHHRTYASYGWERSSDLMAVCDDCHFRIHHPEAANDNIGPQQLELIRTDS